MPRTDWNLVWPPGRGKYLYVECVSGLGNRLKALVSGVRAARVLGRRLAVCWQPDAYHCRCPLGALLEDRFLELTPSFFRTTGFVEYHEVGRRPTFVSRGSRADVVWVREENFFWVSGDEGVVWGQYGPGPAAAGDGTPRGEIRRDFASLVPHHAVRRAADEFYARHMAGRPVVGVHVRRGDNAWALANVPDGLFVPAASAALDEAGPDARVLLATDCPASRESLGRRLAGRVLVFPCRSYDRGSDPEAVQDALAEMVLLSRTRHLVRTSSSTFGQCAAWLGGVPETLVGPAQHPY